MPITLDHALVSIYAVDCDSKKVIIDQNSELSLNPASCLKLVTTAAALDILGAEHRFLTHLEYDGVIDSENTLNGNIYIHGGGDPCLGSDRIPGSLSWEKQIIEWSKAIQKKGIHKITGRIIGDDTHWEKTRACPSWMWEDLGNYYGAGASSLSFHENSYYLTFQSSPHIGQNALILRTDPPVNIQFQNEVTIGPEGSGDKACIYGSELTPCQTIRGTIPAGQDPFVIRGALPNPAQTCAELLANELEKRGISIANEVIKAETRVRIHSHHSPTVAEIVHHTNQKSINIYAEHLLKSMGEGTQAAGTLTITDFLKRHNIALDGIHIIDGSGLSRKNLLTTKQLVTLLQYMKTTDHFSLYLESLPQKTGLVRAKSGSKSHVKGLAGYAGPIAFAIFINNALDAALMNQKIDEILKMLEHAIHTTGKR